MDVASIFASVGAGVVSAGLSGILAYRQGQSAAADRRDEDVEQRLRGAEFELADIRATLRERRPPQPERRKQP